MLEQNVAIHGAHRCRPRPHPRHAQRCLRLVTFFSYFFFFCGTSFLTPAFRYVSRVSYLLSYRAHRRTSNAPSASVSINASDCPAAAAAAVAAAAALLPAGKCEFITRARTHISRRWPFCRSPFPSFHYFFFWWIGYVAEKWHDCFIANVVMLKCRTQIS